MLESLEAEITNISNFSVFEYTGSEDYGSDHYYKLLRMPMLSSSQRLKDTIITSSPPHSIL